jgi:type IV secretion system protein VirD4
VGKTFLSEKQMRYAEVEAMQKWLAWLGPNHLARIRSIDGIFEQRTATIWSTCYADLSWTRQVKARIGPLTSSVKEPAHVFFTVSRSLASMDFRERSYLRFVELLNSAYEGNDVSYRRWRTALLWGDGKGTLTGHSQNSGLEAGDASSPVPTAIRRLNLSVDQTIGAVQQCVTQLLSRDLHPDFRAMLQEFADQLTPAGDGTWLKPSQVPASPFARKSDYVLHIGSFSNGAPLTYSGDGSVVTIAPPGSGKTQCNVFPNLLTWPGPNGVKLRSRRAEART